MVVIVVALDDCTMSVTNAPQNVPDRRGAAALLSVALSLAPASPFRPVVMTLMPSRNRPTPPRTDIVVDMSRRVGWLFAFFQDGSQVMCDQSTDELHADY